MANVQIHDVSAFPAIGELERELALVFQVLVEDEMMILERRGGGRYLQVYANGDGTFHAEVSANRFLPAEAQLDGPELSALRELGWLPPKVGGSPNHHLDMGPPRAAESLAKLAAQTLVRVVGGVGPADLQYRAFNKAGQEVSLPALLALGVARAGEKPFEPMRCPACGSDHVVTDAGGDALVCQHVGLAPMCVAPPLDCKHCGRPFFADGRYLDDHGCRSSMVDGKWQVVAILADDLEQAELGPDGWLCLALLGGSDERFLSVAPQHLARMAVALADALDETGGLAVAAAAGEAAPILALVRKAFAARLVTGRDTFDEFLQGAGIPFERYSWP